MNARRLQPDGPVLIDLADVIGEVADHLRSEGMPVRGTAVDLSALASGVERKKVLPSDLLPGDFLVRPRPASAFRLLDLPRRMGSTGVFRLWGWSAQLGEEVLYRRGEVPVMIVRGIALNDRDRDAIARRERITASMHAGRRG